MVVAALSLAAVYTVDQGTQDYMIIVNNIENAITAKCVVWKF